MIATDSEIKKLAADGKLAFQAGEYESAEQMFTKAVQGFAELGDEINAAEQKNNLSVALLKMGRPMEALEAARGTDVIFAEAHDRKRQGIAVGNEAAALEALKRLDDALSAYERSAALFAEAGEGELRSMVLQAAAGIG